LPVDTTAKPFVPAIIGLNEHHEAAMARNRSRPSRVSTSSMSITTIVLAGIGVVAATVGGSFLLRSALRPKKEEPPPPVSVVVPQVLMLNGIPIQDRLKIDATDLLPSVKRRITEGSLDAALVEISVQGARGGSVDLSNAGSQVSYTYVVAPQGTVAADPLSARERVELVINDAALPAKKGASRGDKAVADPICVWSAAWRAAMASGLSSSSVIDAKYSYNSKSDKAVWVFTVREHPEIEREIDGMSCAIRVRPVGADAGAGKRR